VTEKYSPQRHTRLRRNQKSRDISRKDAKAAKKRNNIYPNLAFFAPWREKYPNPRCFIYIGKFTQAAKTFKHRQSSQRSENFQFKNSFTLRPPRLRGAISKSCFTGKPEDHNFCPCRFRLRLMIVVCADSVPEIQIQVRPRYFPFKRYLATWKRPECVIARPGPPSDSW